MKKTFAEIFISVVFGVALNILFLHEPAFKEQTIHVASILFTLTIFVSIKYWKLRHVLRSLNRIYAHTSSESKKALIGFVKNKMDQLQQTILSTYSNHGATLEQRDIDFLTRICFEFGNGIYNGSDSNTPSVFKKKFRNYLAYNEKNIRKRNEPGIRILQVNIKELHHDLLNNPEDFNDFCNWHVRNSMTLLQVDPEVAMQVAKEHRIGSTDIGIWDSNFAAVFCETPGKTAQVDEMNIIIRDSDTEDFRCCQNYFIELIKHSRRFDVQGDKLNLSEITRQDKEKIIEGVMSQWNQ